MALDGIYLYSLVCELKDKLIGGKIDKINQPENDEIILSIRTKEGNYKLLMSASASFPQIRLSTEQKTNPLVAPMFCMVLRKHLNGAKLKDIRQLSTDRVVMIDLEGSDEMGFDSIYTLIVEIMGRHSNITLVRDRDQIIMDSIKHVTLDINTYRCLYPAIKFVYPPPSLKLDPFNFSDSDFIEKVSHESITDSIFSKLFTGVSKGLSKEIALKLDNDYNNLTSQNTIMIIKNFFGDIQKEEFTFYSYSKEGKVKDFYCLDMKSLCDFTKIKYESASKLVSDFYYEKDKADRLNSKSSDLQKLVMSNIDRCTKKEKAILETLEECNNKNYYKIFGELLTANIYKLKQGMDKIKVENYYDNNKEIEIELDINKSPSSNIQKYFKKYTKLKKSEEAQSIQLEAAKEELLYLQSVFVNIQSADNYESIEEIRKELIETKYIKPKKGDKIKKLKVQKPMHFISSDGIDIYVGKNNIQNDYLTLKFADKHDTWLHTKTIPGSHVIIKKFGDVPEKTLSEAASLAAYYSKGREGTKIPVDYTEVKNVKKPASAKPGMVIYSTNKTIYTEPKSPDDLKISTKN